MSASSTSVKSHFGVVSFRRGLSTLNPWIRRVNRSLGSRSLFMASLTVVDIDDKYPLIVPTALPPSNNVVRYRQSSGDVHLSGSTLVARHQVNHAAHLDCTTAIVPVVRASSMICITLSL